MSDSYIHHLMNNLNLSLKLVPYSFQINKQVEFSEKREMLSLASSVQVVILQLLIITGTENKIFNDCHGYEMLEKSTCSSLRLEIVIMISNK